MRVLIYTSVFGKYDKINIPKISIPGVDFKCFSENNESEFSEQLEGLSPAQKSRWFKFCYTGDYDILMWMDGRYSVNSLDAIVKYIKRFSEIELTSIWFEHPSSRSIYEEMNHIELCNIPNHTQTRKWVNTIKDVSFMTDNSVFFKKNDVELNRILHNVFDEYLVAGRDQVVLPFVFRINKYKQFMVVPHKYRDKMIIKGRHL